MTLRRLLKTKWFSCFANRLGSQNPCYAYAFAGVGHVSGRPVSRRWHVHPATVRCLLLIISEVAREVCEGLCDYFNVALGSFLLYPFERVQLKDVLKTSEAAPLSQIYGAIHLLRLFVKIPSLLSQTATTISTSAVLRDEFIKILQ